MLKKQFKVITFDCDGVMFDTKEANDAYYNTILDHVQLPPMTPDQAAYAHMHTVDEVLAHLIRSPDLRKVADEYRQKMGYGPFRQLMTIEPYLKPLLHKIRPDYSTAIATNRTNTIQQVLLDHGLETQFDLVVSALDVPHPKPSPDQLQKILAHFDINAIQMLYIGDSKVDELAASAANVPFASFDNSQLTADYHISGLKDIETILAL